MTIASEITRLQGAKASARTSIINKGVRVPTNAKLDTYHTYIDLIKTNKSLMSGLKAGYVRIGGYYGPNLGDCISFEEGGTYYGMCPGAREMKSSDTAYSCIDAFKKVSGSDVQHMFLEGGSYNGYYSRNIVNVARFYTNGTTIRCYFCIEYTPSVNPNYYMMYKSEWNYKTNNGPTSPTLIGATGYNTDPTVYGEDLTGYTEITGTNTWVSSCVGDRLSDDGRIYLILK